MPSVPTMAEANAASAEEVKQILGELDDAKLLDIVALRPSVRDVEQASLWLAGDPDVFGGEPLPPVAGDIVAILTADEEEEEGPAR